MADRYATGARVVSLDGVELGEVDHVDREGLIVRLHDGGREMRVPFDVIDEGASTEDRVVVQGAIEGDGAAVTNPRVEEPGDSQTLRLVGEEAIAHVREADRGKVVISKHVETFPHEANVDVGTDRVEVERVPVNEEVDVAPEVRQEGDTLIVPVIEEVLVVTKRYRIVEEVHVRKVRDIETKTFTEDLRREVVDVREIDEHGEEVER
ncbi:MAG TPA: YsnF/AvaK domain-containing protein [Thermomicrobiales bacterium]|nr:YsnF/AvaK domain-containing protein [Thermomicrobiales bacterium]